MPVLIPPVIVLDLKIDYSPKGEVLKLIYTKNQKIRANKELKVEVCPQGVLRRSPLGPSERKPNRNFSADNTIIQLKFKRATETKKVYSTLVSPLGGQGSIPFL